VDTILLMLKQVVLPISDLHRVIWKCAHCPTEIALDLRHSVQQGDSAALFCPGCKQLLNSEIKASIDAFRVAYQALIDVGSVIGFRIKADEPSKLEQFPS
jgi:hypothetical protein